MGTLSIACKIVPAGSIFLRRLIDLSCTVRRMHYQIRITEAARLDMQWWLDFLPSWPGTSLKFETDWSSSSAMHLFTDASIQDCMLGCILVMPVASGPLVSHSVSEKHCLERAVCHCLRYKLLGSPLE